MQQPPMSGTASGAVYVQSNAAPNEVIAFRRGADGSLDLIGSETTGGEGDGSRHLASQGSVVLTGDGRHLLVTNAASDDLSVFSVAADGSIELRELVPAGVTPDDRFAFATNFADGAVSRFAIAADGSLSLEDATVGVSVDGMPGLRDEDLSSDGRFLYAIDTDGGRVYGWSVDADGTLELIGSWGGLPETVAGLAAS
jgi:6-phosphogluconolactonase